MSSISDHLFPPDHPRLRGVWLGEHSREFLRGPGCDGAAIDALIADGVTGAPR